ncbi:hypothetical protein [Flavobacterium pedocola]
MKTVKLSMLLVVILSLISFNKTNDNNDDQILWDSNRKLVWEDFKGNVDTSMPNTEALTASIIEVTASYYENEIPKFNISSYFIKSQSWTTTNSVFTLEHEQLHFDITEIFARKIRKEFEILYTKKCTDISKYEEVHSRLGALCKKYQNDYDKAVYSNDTAQKIWSQKVAGELFRLKKYAYIPTEKK